MDEFNNPSQCGICSKGTHSYTTLQNKTKFYCQSCMHFKILKLKLGQINLEFFDGRARAEIDKVLGNCINESASSFLTNFLDTDEKEQHANHDNKDKLQTLVPSNKSVAKLAHMLMNVELAQYKKKLGQLELKVQENDTHNRVLKDKIKALDERLKQQRQKLTETQHQLSENHQTTMMNVESSKSELKDVKLRNIEKHLINLRTRKVQNVIRILDVMVIENSNTDKNERSVLVPSTFLKPGDSNPIGTTLLTRTLQNSLWFKALPKMDGLCLSIQFVPIIPLTKYLNYSVKLINKSLEKVCVLINLIVSYLSVCLPYPLIRNDNDDDLIYCTGYIVQNYLTSESFPLFIKSKNEKADPVEALLDLNSTQINNFSAAISRLIINIVYLSEKIGKPLNIDEVKFNDLLRIDQLLVEMVRTYGTSKDINKKQDVSAKTVNNKSSPFGQFWSKLKGLNSSPIDKKKEEEEQTEQKEEEKTRDLEERTVSERLSFLSEYMKIETVSISARIINGNPLSSSTSSASTVQVPTVHSSNIITPVNPVSTDKSFVQDVNKLSQKIEDYFRNEIQKLYEANNLSNTTNTIDSSTFQQVTISNLAAGANSISVARSMSDSPRFKPINGPSLESSFGSTNLVLNGNGWKKNHRPLAMTQPSTSRLPKAGLSTNNKKPSLDNWEMI